MMTSEACIIHVVGVVALLKAVSESVPNIAEMY